MTSTTTIMITTTRMARLPTAGTIIDGAAMSKPNSLETRNTR
jgi:hypothetical protein